jgi:hypothetical protein
MALIVVLVVVAGWVYRSRQPPVILPRSQREFGRPPTPDTVKGV